MKVGDQVEKGDIIADGPSTELGELALGRNVLVAFMPWNGYNFEDSILISERIVRDDVFTSIHIEEFEVMARDTKLGQEEITRDIPNVGEEALKNLDEAGIVYIGAEVKPGDILVGKVTPKGESPMTPEEKLLRAIFGEKASDVRDTSLRLPPGVAGHDRRGARLLPPRRRQGRARARHRARRDRAPGQGPRRREGHPRAQLLRPPPGAAGRPDGGRRAQGREGGHAHHRRGAGRVSRPASGGRSRSRPTSGMAEIEALEEAVRRAHQARSQDRFDNKVEKLQRGDELPPGVMKMVKVFVAVKRKLQPGDKMAGRHGNKGVISRIMPIEDMPYLEDGTPVDIVLNPLGVPSPHERRPDPRDPSRLGLRPVSASRSARCSTGVRAARQDRASCASSCSEIYGESGYKAEIAELDDDAADRARRATCSRGVPIAIAGVRRRARGRHRRDAGDGRARHVGPGRRWSTAAPASRSTAR